MSDKTLHHHHDKHHAKYVDTLNTLLKDKPDAGSTLESVIASARDGLTYRTRREATAAAQVLLSEGSSPVFATAARNWLAPLEARAMETREQVPHASPYLGEAFTASAGSAGGTACLAEPLPLPLADSPVAAVPAAASAVAT